MSDSISASEGTLREDFSIPVTNGNYGTNDIKPVAAIMENTFESYLWREIFAGSRTCARWPPPIKLRMSSWLEAEPEP